MTVGPLAALARLDGMPSEPTLRRLIAARPDFPVVRVGGAGARYQLDLNAAAAFVRAAWRDRRRRADEQAEQPDADDDRVVTAGVEATAPTGGSLAELAAIEGMPSLPSLQRFIRTRADFPIIQRGRRGKPFILDLDRAAEFVRSMWRDGRRLGPDEEAQLAERRAAQLTLPGLEAAEAQA